MIGGNGYDQRGLVPRTLTKLYNEIKLNSQLICKVYISFLEIYNEQVC